jgi:hypothetical protein
LTLLGCLGGAGLITRAWEKVRGGDRPALLLAFTVLHIPFLLIAGTLFDRYLLVLLPGALALAVTAAPVTRPRLGAALGVLAVFAWLSVSLMHDWLAWNSARWALGRRAVEQRHISATDIEGGFEWDGWFAVNVRPVNDRPARGLVLPFNQCIFPDLTGRYGLAASVPAGTVAVDREPYRLWLRRGTQYFYLVKPQNEAREEPRTGPDDGVRDASRKR